MPKLPQLLQSHDVAFSFWVKDVPESALVVTAFAAEEAMSGLTRTEVMLVSRDAAIDLNAMLDTPATLTIHHKYLETPRHFSGVVVEAERGDSGHHRTAYKVTLLPVLYRLDIQSDSRIFQGQSVPDIAKAVFAENGIENIQWELTAEHLTREYCTQYRESHLAFIERILAEEGIFYFLRHDDKGRHT
ncbi:type VI secretion system tip protein VgrG, partial [Neorhizobium sp. T786]|uniref:type VI secretion system Vgr family protein n=1 Tax=Pseudorhizobium xiangyangii TaxID=2883104 RepID=UPI001CFFD3A7